MARVLKYGKKYTVRLSEQAEVEIKKRTAKTGETEAVALRNIIHKALKIEEAKS